MRQALCWCYFACSRTRII